MNGGKLVAAEVADESAVPLVPAATAADMEGLDLMTKLPQIANSCQRLIRCEHYGCGE